MAILLNELIEETPDLESINYEKHSPNHETTHHKSIRCLADNEQFDPMAYGLIFWPLPLILLGLGIFVLIKKCCQRRALQQQERQRQQRRMQQRQRKIAKENQQKIEMQKKQWRKRHRSFEGDMERNKQFQTPLKDCTFRKQFNQNENQRQFEQQEIMERQHIQRSGEIPKINKFRIKNIVRNMNLKGVQSLNEFSDNSMQRKALMQTCALCLDKKCNVYLPCMHFYHRQCIEEWIKRKNDCPCCRRQAKDPMIKSVKKK